MATEKLDWRLDFKIYSPLWRLDFFHTKTAATGPELHRKWMLMRHLTRQQQQRDLTDIGGDVDVIMLPKSLHLIKGVSLPPSGTCSSSKYASSLWILAVKYWSRPGSIELRFLLHKRIFLAILSVILLLMLRSFFILPISWSVNLSSIFSSGNNSTLTQRPRRLT